MPFRRSDAGLECLSVYRASVVQRMRAFSRAQHAVSTIICWCSRSSRAGGDSARKKKGEFFAEQALQPAHEPYRHTASLHAAMVLPSPSGFSPSCRKLGAGMLTRRHCRWSQQEIKCQLWYAGHCLISRTGRRLPQAPNRLRKTLRLRRAKESERRLPAHVRDRRAEAGGGYLSAGFEAVIELQENLEFPVAGRTAASADLPVGRFVERAVESYF